MPEQHDTGAEMAALLRDTDFLRAVIEENASRLPEAEDLVSQWDGIRPDAMDRRLPMYRA